MKERPINFKAWEVQAIRAGRKTQFRRVVNPQPAWPARHPSIIGPRIECHNGLAGMYSISSTLMQEFGFARCPCGAPGDRLWVRETWQFCDYDGPGGDPKTDVVFRADGETDDKRSGWKSPIHMPRWASRITLEVVSVRVERLQDISEEDAIAEGCSFVPGEGTIPGHYLGGVHPIKGNRKTFPIPMQAYRSLWQSDNSPESWAENPWVWVVEFRQV